MVIAVVSIVVACLLLSIFVVGIRRAESLARRTSTDVSKAIPSIGGTDNSSTTIVPDEDQDTTGSLSETDPPVKSATESSQNQDLAEIRSLVTKACEELDQLTSDQIGWRYGHLNVSKLRLAKNEDFTLKQLVSRKSRPQNYSPLVDIFLDLGIKLYHFTAVKNVESIQEFGLLSTTELSQIGISPTRVSSDGSQLSDRYLGLDEYVHLCFTTQATMAWAAQSRSPHRITWYEVSPIVLDFRDTLYCRDYANKRGAVTIPANQISALDLYALATNMERIGYWQLLVPRKIESRYLRPIQYMG